MTKPSGFQILKAMARVAFKNWLRDLIALPGLILRYTWTIMQNSVRQLRERLQWFYLGPFEYTGLQSSTSVRLLTIEPGSLATPLSCRLEDVSLDDGLEFLALSYSWRMDRSIKMFIYYFLMDFLMDFRLINLRLMEFLMDFLIDGSSTDGTIDRVLRLTNPKDIRRWITCNGKRIGVTQNLYNAMLRLRQSYPKKRFWIDALSINQGDIDERNTQVQLMSRIYSSADKVIAWIGEVPGTLAMFRDVDGIVYLDNLLQFHTPADVLTHESSLKPAMYDLILIVIAAVSLYVLSRRWFRRAWIVQEVVVAKDLVILFGNRELSAEVLTRALEFVNDPVRRNVVSDLLLSTVLSWFKGTSVHSFRALLDARGKFDMDNPWDLGEYLLAVRGRDSTEPQDMVFAGLGLVDKTSLSIREELSQQDNGEWSLWQSLQADYTASLKDVYVNCAAALLCGPTGLYALAYADSGSTPSALPSWVPALGRRRILLKEHMRETAKAGSNSSRDPNISISEQGMVLTLHDGAELFDKVDTMLELSTPKIRDIVALFWTLPDTYEPTGERMLSAIGRTLIADRLEGQPPAPESVEDELVAWMEELITEEKTNIYREAANENGEDYDRTQDLSTITKVKEMTQPFAKFLRKHGRQSRDSHFLSPLPKLEMGIIRQRRVLQRAQTWPNTEIIASPDPGLASSSPIAAPDVSHCSTTTQSHLATTDANSEPTPGFFKESSSFLTGIDKICSDHVFFITSNGYIGMGSRDMRSKSKAQKEEHSEDATAVGLESPVSKLRPITSIMVVAGAEVPFAMNAVCDFVIRQPFSVMENDHSMHAFQAKRAGLDGPGLDLKASAEDISADTNKERIEVLDAAERKSWQDGTAMYEMSGEVYVHGIMGGERTRSDEWNPKKIYLL